MLFEPNQGVKILKKDYGTLESCHGGTYTWDPPKLKEDGSYEPGAWTVPVEPRVRIRGYHLARSDIHGWWWGSRFVAYLAEYKGAAVSFTDRAGQSDDSCFAVETCRLLRPLTSKELASLNVFIDGKHEVRGGEWVAAGTAFVTALEGAYVGCFDSACVDSSDNKYRYR